MALVIPQPPASGETKLALSSENIAPALQSAGSTARAGQTRARCQRSARRIAPLIELARYGTDRAKEEAAGALANLAVNAVNSVAILAAGGIAPLVELTRSGTDGAGPMMIELPNVSPPPRAAKVEL